ALAILPNSSSKVLFTPDSLSSSLAKFFFGPKTLPGVAANATSAAFEPPVMPTIKIYLLMVERGYHCFREFSQLLELSDAPPVKLSPCHQWSFGPSMGTYNGRQSCFVLQLQIFATFLLARTLSRCSSFRLILCLNFLLLFSGWLRF
ncbi:hypothetical protein HID58_046893, partial [Brassica napus]